MTAVLLQNTTEMYHKMREVFYFKMRQIFYKMRQLLQNATISSQNAMFITKAVHYSSVQFIATVK